MTVDRFREALDDLDSETRAPPTVTTLPDGSVDRYCRLAAGGHDPVARRRTFAREVTGGGREEFGLRPKGGEPGGKCVNAATQAHALGGEVTCYGHLDHAVLTELPFETVSMGRPATVFVLDFDDGDLMLVEGSGDLAEWTLDDLEAVAPLDRVFDADAVGWTNWTSIPGTEAAFHVLSRADLPRVPLVFDPGNVLGTGVEGHRRLRDAISALQRTFDVTLSLNRTELRAMTAASPDPPSPPADDHDRLLTLRETLGVTAVGKHAADEAAVATAAGVVAVPSERFDRPARQTGGGDRFSGALAFALGAGWDWPVALRCANEAAAHYVKTGETADVDALLEGVAERR